MPKADIVLEISFKLDKPEKTVIRTSTERDAVEEMLNEWLSNQMFEGEDDNPPNEKDEYTIVIRFDSSDGTFYTTSDTDNKGLTYSIVSYVFYILDLITIICDQVSLEEFERFIETAEGTEALMDHIDSCGICSVEVKKAFNTQAEALESIARSFKKSFRDSRKEGG